MTRPKKIKVHTCPSSTSRCNPHRPQSYQPAVLTAFKMETPPQQQPLPVLKASAASLLLDAERIIAKTRAFQVALVESTALSCATFRNVVLPLAEAEDALLIESRRLLFHRDVSPDPVIRDASSKANELLQDFQVETCLNEPLYKLIDAAYQAIDTESPDVEARRYLDRRRRDFAVNGLSLPAGPQRERFKEIKSRLAELEKDFQKNLTDSKLPECGVWFSREQLEGVPATVLDRLESGKGDNAGLLRVTMRNSDVFPILRLAHDEATRKRLYIAYESSVPADVEILKEAIILRNSAAKLLGYEDHATFRIEEKMAKTPEIVNKFLSELTGSLAPGAKDEIKRMQQLKREHAAAREQRCDERIFVWDTSFYNTLDLKAKHSVDNQAISEYFPLEMVVSSMLRMFEDLLGFHFVEVPQEEKRDKVWHEDVQVFYTWNAEDLGGQFIGWLYLDLYPRPGKVGYACSLNLIPVRCP